ncbi:hypothetical protein [Yaravirus sp. 'brasiliensis']|uniref:Uncharacterized protein n=1 Tax=Yaravirus sp. 'brasiliensis' TaxID=2739681 RepID=A0AAE7B627_9VIRU|nr:hypothetical protein QKS73_gp59 [Yaravirus brasiliensis]QKE44418.1 hypothetical protein [Yaravirus brasiliensis]
MQYLMRPKIIDMAPSDPEYFPDWSHAVECLGFNEFFLGAFAANHVEYDANVPPTEETLRKLYRGLLDESEDWWFATEYTEETIAGDLGQKLAAIRLYVQPNLAGVLTTPEYLYILENLPVFLCVTFLLEGMLLLRSRFHRTMLSGRPMQALRNSPADVAMLFESFDIRNQVINSVDKEKEKEIEYIIID